MKRFLRVSLLALALLAGAALAVLGWVQWRATALTWQDVDRVPARPVAIVFGAGISAGGRLTPMLQDRVDTAIDLYRSGKVRKLLMSGDNRFVDYDEPGRMYDYAVAQGVPPEDIVRDYAGRRTYDTCYRARHIFNVREAILVTQTFHMPRALITCNSLGIESTGVPAEIRRYLRRAYAYWYLREIPATTVAFWEVWVTRPLPVLGKPEPIFTENSTLVGN
jgi:SanA protein